MSVTGTYSQIWWEKSEKKLFCGTYDPKLGQNGANLVVGGAQKPLWNTEKYLKWHENWHNTASTTLFSVNTLINKF